MPIGCKVTLRGDRMYEFLDRLLTIALPRIRDFRGINPNSFDGRGNFSMGVREQIIFPEIDYDDVHEVRGLDITITTTATNDDEARELLRELGMPFAELDEEGRDGNRGNRSQSRRGRRSTRPARYNRCRALRPPARVLPQVRRVPDLPARARAPGRDPRHDQEQLVSTHDH